MEIKPNTSNQYIIKDQRINRSLFHRDQPAEYTDGASLYDKFASEGCEDFYNYIDWIGLAKDPDLIVLSTSHHYYYDAEEMKDVSTVINLKKINEIRQIKEFLSNIFDILPQGSFFAGYFSDNNNQSRFIGDDQRLQRQRARRLEAVENGIVSNNSFINMMYNIMDSRTNRSMTKMAATLLLKEAGFKVLDMTELNGHTYFCAEKTSPS